MFSTKEDYRALVKKLQRLGLEIDAPDDDADDGNPRRRQERFCDILAAAAMTRAMNLRGEC